MNDGFKDILFRYNAFHVLYQIEGLLYFFILKVVNYKVQSCLRNDINQRWQCLKSILSTSENDQIVSQ